MNAPAPATRPDQAPTPGQLPGPAPWSAPAPGYAQADPFARPRRPGARTYLVLGLVAAVIVGLCGAGYVTQSLMFGPEAAVNGYFDALADRDAKAALGYLVPQYASGDNVDRKLLSDAALKGKGYAPPSDVTIKRVEDIKIPEYGTPGGTKQKRAELSFTIGGRTYQTTLVLQRDEQTSYGLFHRWRVLGGLSTLTVDAPYGSPLMINGISSPSRTASDGSAPTRLAFPGRYPVALADNPLLEAEGTTVDVGPEGGRVTMDVRLKDSAQEEAQRQVKAYLDECAESTELEPQGCPFSVYSYGTVTDVKWTIEKYPPVIVDLASEGFVSVYTDSYEYGVAKVTGKYDGHTFSQEVTFQVSGTVSAFKDDIVFAPSN
jgi:hypothetical protein